MGLSKIIEHSKNYLVNIQVFGDRTFEDVPSELNYLATSFEIIYSGGSDFVNQKGRTIASAFATQPNVSINLSCFMTEPDFAVLTSVIITEQQQVLLTIGKLKEVIDSLLPADLLDTSATIHEAIGFLKDAKISASVGEFIRVDFTLNVDDMRDINQDNLPVFEP